MRAFVHADPDEVGGQQVGGELDPLPGAVDRAGERLGEAGLADAGNVLDQQVALGQQRHHRELDRFALAVHDGGDVADDARRRASRSWWSGGACPSRHRRVDAGGLSRDAGVRCCHGPDRYGATRGATPCRVRVRSSAPSGPHASVDRARDRARRRSASRRAAELAEEAPTPVESRCRDRLPRDRSRRQPAGGGDRRRRRRGRRPRPRRDAGAQRVAGADAAGRAG